MQAGCFNRDPLAHSYLVPVRNEPGALIPYKWEVIVHRMSVECQQDGTLKECEGCKHRSTP